MTDRPDIVCICGSARFLPEMREANRELTFKGVIVLAPSEADEAPTPEQKTVLDALHLSKIDLADRVLVVNPGGYVGESTQKEIAYAQALGKLVTFTDPRERPRHSVPRRFGALTLLAAAVLFAGCSSDQEDGSTLKADPHLPFASFERPGDGSTLKYRGELMAPDWDLLGTVALRGECLGVVYTDDSGDDRFVTLALPMPVAWDKGSQTVSGTGYEFAVGDELEVSGMLIEDDSALPTTCQGETRQILVSNDAWIS